jgi:hypothetical protein
VVERCSRTQCDAPAAARVAFDAIMAFVWLDRFESEGPLDVSARGAGALCARHADRLVPPRGWAIQDRRGRDLQLWSERPLPPDAPPASGPARSGTRATRSAHLHDRDPDGPDSPRRPVAGAEPAHLPFAAPVEAHDAPAPEGFDVERMLAAPRSRLLTRAFNAAQSRQAR